MIRINEIMHAKRCVTSIYIHKDKSAAPESQPSNQSNKTKSIMKVTRISSKYFSVTSNHICFDLNMYSYSKVNDVRCLF